MHDPRTHPPRAGLLAALQRVTRSVSAHLEARLAESGVSMLEAHVLVHLNVPAHHPARSIADLHRAFALRPSTLTSVLDRLETRRLVQRSIHPRDRRSFLVRLTDLGAMRTEEVQAVLDSFEARVADRLAPADQVGFERLVEVLEDVAGGRRLASRRA